LREKIIWFYAPGKLQNHLARYPEEGYEELLRKIDAEYGFKLTEEEMSRIENDAKEAEWLFQQVNEVDVSGKAPFMKLALKGSKS
jgi:hypothetical protein